MRKLLNGARPAMPCSCTLSLCCMANMWRHERAATCSLLWQPMPHCCEGSWLGSNGVCVYSKRQMSNPCYWEPMRCWRGRRLLPLGAA